MSDIFQEIELLKSERNAIVLAHNYQRPEVQDAADIVGDSLGLAMEASRTDAEIIVFAGVKFMAETAKIVNPSRKVIVPEINATCPMANMITAADIEELRSENPGAPVVAYVNTTAATKTMVDVCCTSSNAVKAVRELKEDTVIFIPDVNLGQFIQRNVPEKKIILHPGYCVTHMGIKRQDIEILREQHPDAFVMVHPECTPEVIDAADGVYSTEGMLKKARESAFTEFIVGTEKEMCYRLEKETGKNFYPAGNPVCRNMKKTTIEKVRNALRTGETEILLDKEIIRKAKRPLERMLETGRDD